MVDVREYNPSSPGGSKRSSMRTALTRTLFHIEISLREMRESFVEAPPCHTRRKLHVKASAKPVQDLDKADIIGGGDLYKQVNSLTP